MIGSLVAEAAKEFPHVSCRVTPAFGVNEKLAEVIALRAGIDSWLSLLAMRSATLCTVALTENEGIHGSWYSALPIVNRSVCPTGTLPIVPFVTDYVWASPEDLDTPHHK